MPNMIDIYWTLLIVHLLYDWHWQGEFVGVYKATSDVIMFIHCLTWASLMYAVFLYWSLNYIWIFWWLFISHLVIDWWKVRVVPKEKRLTDKYLEIDQSLHLVSVIIVFWVLRWQGII